MATTYRIYQRDIDATFDVLTFMGEAEAASAAGAARAFFTNGKNVPERIVCIPERAVHELAPSIETHTRLRLS